MSDLFEIVSEGSGSRLVYRGKSPKSARGALNLSIRKWQFIADHPGPYSDGGGTTCGLCMLYRFDCDKCPVGVYTGSEFCCETPYYMHRVTCIQTPFDQEKAARLAREFVDLLVEIKHHPEVWRGK